MTEILKTIIIFLLFTNVLIPSIIAWLVIKYIFFLRKRQDEEFLYNIGFVINDAVRDALQGENITSDEEAKQDQQNENKTD